MHFNKTLLSTIHTVGTCHYTKDQSFNSLTLFLLLRLRLVWCFISTGRDIWGEPWETQRCFDSCGVTKPTYFWEKQNDILLMYNCIILPFFHPQCCQSMHFHTRPIFTAAKKFGKVLHLSVILSVGVEGGWYITYNMRQVCILLECFLILLNYTTHISTNK